MQSEQMSYREVTRAIKVSMGTHGVRGLYLGWAPTILRDVPFSAIYWSVVELLRSRLIRWSGREETHICLSATAGAVGGIVAALCTGPFDVVKTRRQILLGQALSTGKASPQASVIDVMRDVVSKGGYRALWSGSTPRIAKVAMACAIMLGSNYLQRHEAKLNDRIAQLTEELAKARREIVKLGGNVDAPAAARKKRSAIRSINGRFIRRTKQQDVARRDDSEEEDGVPDDESASVCSNSTDTRSTESTGPAEKMARTTFKPFYHQGKIADGVELVVAPAEGKGEGVFTKKALKKGEFIGDYGGFVSLTSASQAMDSDYLYMTTFGPEGHPVIIDAAPPHGNVFAKLNHSCRPNLVPKELPKPEPSGIFAVGFTTRRYVAPEEELTVDYTRTWWKARPEKVCMCEEVNCKWTDPRKEED
ncbi:unnamed protein product, partial [Mesorhabditis spiculigera]